MNVHPIRPTPGQVFTDTEYDQIVDAIKTRLYSGTEPVNVLYADLFAYLVDVALLDITRTPTHGQVAAARSMIASVLTDIVNHWEANDD